MKTQDLSQIFEDPTPILMYSEPELIEKIVQRIERERLRQNLTQEELAKISGVSVGTYRNFVYKKQISLLNLISIMKYLRMENALRLLVDEPLETEVAEVLMLLEEKKSKLRKKASGKKLKKI